MKKLLFLLLISVSHILTGCTNTNDTNELPAIVFLVRTDISEELSGMSANEIAQQNIAVKSLGFYDMNGDYYISTDPELNALDNKTLIAEYEAGHLTEQIQYYTSCDVNFLTEQYAKLHKIYLTGQLEIVYPNELPTVQAESSTWFGYYFGQDGEIQYQAIHEKERMTELYTNNDTVNEVYDRIIETFGNTQQSK